MLHSSADNFESQNGVKLRVRKISETDKKRPASGTQVIVKKITGLAPMSRVTTNFGDVHAHVLRKGDMVRTVQGHFARITRIDRIRLDEEFVSRYPAVLPIRIRKNALGPDVPKVDTMFAPYQVIRPGPARSMTKLQAASELLTRPFVERAKEHQITYTRIYLDKAAEIVCEGLPVPVEADCS